MRMFYKLFNKKRKKVDDLGSKIFSNDVNELMENNFNVMISPLVKNIDKFNYWLEALPFYRNVQKEGIVL